MSPANRQLLRIAIGLVVSYVVGSIIMGDPFTTWTLIVASIICTLGISLIMWVPLWWLIGWVVLAIFELLRERIQPTSDAQLQTTPAVSRDAIALSAYIRRSRQAGASDSQITTRLKEQGWTEAEITQAFES